MIRYKMYITLAGVTKDDNALEAVKLLGQRNANEMLVASQFLPNFVGIGPPRVTLSISINNREAEDLEFKEIIQVTDEEKDDKEDPFAAM